MKEITYQREKVKQYAEKWAYLRNPAYYNYDDLGGDCTNFVSQCILEGAKVMNYTSNGWYYKNANQKAPAWTGVEFLYQFLIHNQSVGPYGKVINIEEIEIGDIIQLSFASQVYSHSLIVVDKEAIDLDHIYVATHTFDSYHRAISSYLYENIRFIHIQGAKNW